MLASFRIRRFTGPRSSLISVLAVLIELLLRRGAGKSGLRVDLKTLGRFSTALILSPQRRLREQGCRYVLLTDRT
jgi:hypothetical protein